MSLTCGTKSSYARYSEKSFNLECKVRELEARNQKDFVWRGKEISRLNDEVDELKEKLEAAEMQIVNLKQNCENDPRIHEIVDLKESVAELATENARIAEQREYYEGVIADGSKRIAELEAKLETADKLQDSAFRDGLKAGFSYGQTDDQSGFTQCMSAYSTHAGIKREGE
ncbi:ead/Ea22-like family protein [Salmonella enterica]